MPRADSVCGRPLNHRTHCVSVETWERVRQRNARRLLAAKLLEDLLAETSSVLANAQNS
jgi:hypothetical protein